MDEKLEHPVTPSEEESEVQHALRPWIKPDFERIPLNEASSGVAARFDQAGSS